MFAGGGSGHASRRKRRRLPLRHHRMAICRLGSSVGDRTACPPNQQIVANRERQAATDRERIRHLNSRAVDA